MSENVDVVVKQSKIHKKGVVANRDFKKGEVVLRWKIELLTDFEIKKLLRKERNFLNRDENGKCFLIQSPERYINHSCEANTEEINKCDVAVRNIKKGEEITSDYSKGDYFVSFVCNCGSKKCRGYIKSKHNPA